MNSKSHLNLILLSLIFISPLALLSESLVNTTRYNIDQWVETEQIISEEKSQWKIEEELLQKTHNLLNSELNRLNLALDDLESSVSAAEEERASLNEKKENLKAGESVILRNIENLEASIKSILPSLPEPLLKELNPVIKRLNQMENSVSGNITDRLQNILLILNKANKFNSNIKSVTELRKSEDGKTIQVTTLYLGLASAYYVDGVGEISGIGRPTLNGWEWFEDNSISNEIRKLADIYNGSDVDIEFISIPSKLINL